MFILWTADNLVLKLAQVIEDFENKLIKVAESRNHLNDSVLLKDEALHQSVMTVSLNNSYWLCSGQIPEHC